ncbi:MAG: hypothetical protein PVF24_08950, partial [Desulfobacterales bacterium]
ESTNYYGAKNMTAFDRSKINAVYKYLSIGFPEFSIDQAYDKDHMAPTFSVKNNDEIYVLKFIPKFWDRCDAGTLFKRLKTLDVANALRKNPQENIIVNQGVYLSYEPK